MSTRVSYLVGRSKDAARYVRRARDGLGLSPADWRSGTKALSALGSSVEKLRDAGEHHARLAVLVGAGSAAVAAGTVYAMRHTASPYADVLSDEQPYRVSTLEALKNDTEALATIQRELLAEWGPFAPRDLDDMQRLVGNAGRMTFVVRFYEDGELGPPSGVLQTALAPANGDPERLVAEYPTFDAITAIGTWGASPSMRGDTAVLLQITAFGDRSRGVGSRLRDTALNMMPPSVRYALTTTPVPADFTLESDPESSPAVRFHYRGGARPSGYASGFKIPAIERATWPDGRQSNRDVVFMRYTRAENGDWEGVQRPDMRLRTRNLELAALPAAVRRLRAVAPGRQQEAA